MTPLGATYREGLPGGPQFSIDAAAISDLSLAVIDTDGMTNLAVEDSGGLGVPEKILSMELSQPGEYFVRIRGMEDDVQLYRFDVSATYVPEPMGLVTLWIGLMLPIVNRRRCG